MVLNEWGCLVRRQIKETERMRKDIGIPSCIVMPNHVHLIIQIKDSQRAVGARCARPLHATNSFDGKPRDRVPARCARPLHATNSFDGKPRDRVPARCARPLHATNSFDENAGLRYAHAGEQTVPASDWGARSAPLRRGSSLSMVVAGIKSACTSKIRAMEKQPTLKL